MKRLILLGSTGSIGTSTLDVVRQHRDDFQVVGLAVNRRATDLLLQAEEFTPTAIAVADVEAARRTRTAGFTGELLTGPEAPERLVRETGGD